VAAEDDEVTAARDELVPEPAQWSQSHVRWPSRTRRPHEAQNRSPRRSALRRPGMASAAAKAAASRTATSSGSSTPALSGRWRLRAGIPVAGEALHCLRAVCRLVTGAPAEII